MYSHDFKDKKRKKIKRVINLNNIAGLKGNNHLMYE